MPAKHLNLSTVVDKNKVSSDKTFLIMFKVTVLDHNEDEVATVRFVKNSENVTFMGELYVAANFDLQIAVESGKEPEVTLSCQDQTRALSSYIDAYDGLVKSPVNLIIAHSESLDGPAEMNEQFLVTECTSNQDVVSIRLGVESAVAQRFPNFRQFKNRCAWKYKGVRCGYSGPLPTCDYSRDGPNGCAAHGNEINFGGMPGLNDLF